MALGAMTIVSKTPLPKGAQLVKVSFAGDNAYPTGGTTGANTEAVLATAIATAVAAASDKNVRGVEDFTIVDVIPGDCGQYEPSWTGGKLKVRDGGHATWNEVGNGSNLSGTTFNLTFVCK